VTQFTLGRIAPGTPAETSYRLGREHSWLAPWANLRVGIQYIAYSNFNGSRDNYDGWSPAPPHSVYGGV